MRLLRSSAILLFALLALSVGARIPHGGVASPFPLSIDSAGRHFNDVKGNAFLPVIDAGWEATVQLSNAQIDQYLNDRRSRGFTCTILQLVTNWYSSQQPTYQTPAGNNPFTTMNNSGSPNFIATAIDFSAPVTAYWSGSADYYIQASKARGMCVFAFPAYVGFPSTPQGVYTAVMADTTAHLQSYGAFLWQRYCQYGNIIWGAAGDNTLSQADLTQYWNIIQGMRGTTQCGNPLLVYAKGQRHTSGWTMLTNDGGLGLYPGFNVNNAYIKNETGNYTQVTDTLAEYARTPTMPVFVDETDYEGDGTATANDERLAMWGPLFSGALGGVSFGNEQLWGFGCANNLIANGPAATLASSLNTTGAQNTTVLANFISQWHWEKLAPSVGATFVTTSLGTGATTISPAVASDGSLAVIYFAGGGSATANLNVMTPSTFVAQWYDPTNSTYTTASGSPFTNTGTHTFTTPGNNSLGDPDWVLVLH